MICRDVLGFAAVCRLALRPLSATTRKSGISTMFRVLWLSASGLQVAAQTNVATDLGTTFTTLHGFDRTDGTKSFAGLVQATNGDLYGTTYYGGAKNSGEVFEITLGGRLTTLYSLCSARGCTDGEYTCATPVQAGGRRSARSVRWSPSASFKDVAQMLPEEKLGAPPREAMCAVRP
jgi:uncharacterized repeat protein (TIGR03803 family)